MIILGSVFHGRDYKLFVYIKVTANFTIKKKNVLHTLLSFDENIQYTFYVKLN